MTGPTEKPTPTHRKAIVKSRFHPAALNSALLSVKMAAAIVALAIVMKEHTKRPTRNPRFLRHSGPQHPATMNIITTTSPNAMAKMWNANWA